MAGPSHVALGLPNQDAWLVRRYRWGQVVAVSDGIGASAHAEVGSRAACVIVMEAAKRLRADTQVGFEQLPEVIMDLWPAFLGGRAPEACGATCLFAVVPVVGTAWIGQLGDGLVAALGFGVGGDRLLSGPEAAFSNVTIGLGGAVSREDWLVTSVPVEACQGFLLCTDGISDDLRPDGRSAFIKEVVAHYRTVSPVNRRRDLACWLRDWPVPGHMDDKTIACLYLDEVLHG